MVTRFQMGSLKPKQLLDLYHATSPSLEPNNYKIALNHPLWRKAMQAEFIALTSHQTWSFEPPPPNQIVLGSRWIFMAKLHTNGIISRYKAYLVAQGYKQQEGLDYTAKFSPVAKIPIVKLFITIATYFKWHIYQLDVSNAFLHGNLEEVVYMY